jgi:hypothetical protein
MNDDVHTPWGSLYTNAAPLLAQQKGADNYKYCCSGEIWFDNLHSPSVSQMPFHSAKETTLLLPIVHGEVLIEDVFWC